VLGQVEGILGRLSEADNESGRYLSEMRPWLFQGLNIPPLVLDRTYSSLRLMGIVVGLLLLLSCTNVANLLLFRSLRRRGTIATLRALGASTGRIARQQLALSLLIGVLGTIAGIGVGWLVSLPFKGASLVRMPPFEGLVLDGRILLFGALTSVFTAIIFGALPSIVAGRFELAGALRGSSGRETGRLAKVRYALSTLQLSLGLALLVGAMLLVRTMQNLNAVDLGLDTENVVALSLDLPRDLELDERDLLYEELIATVVSLPEVSSGAIDPHGPVGASMVGRVSLPGAAQDQVLRPYLVPITPGWLELVHARVVNGRTFRADDWNAAPPAPVVLTESLARQLFGRTDVAGERIDAGFGSGNPAEIIGVIQDIRSPYSPDRPQDTFFMTPDGLPWALPMTTLVMRVSSFDRDVAGRIRSTVEGVLPHEPVPDPTLISERLDQVHSESRVYRNLMTLLAALAILLSAVGLYGVIAVSVTSRTREFGIRLALGAETSRIFRLVAVNVASIVVAGTLCGFAGAFALSRLLQSRLFGVTPLDPASYAAAAVMFMLVAMVACWIPTQRAVGVDPVSTLREE